MRGVGIFWGLAIITLGLLVLLDTTGIFHLNFGVVAGVFLVILGAWLLWRWRYPPARAVAEGEHRKHELEGAKSASVRIRHGAGRLTIVGGTEPGLVFQGTFGGGLDVRARKRGDRMDAELRPLEGTVAPAVFPGMWAPGAGLDWNVSLTDTVPMTLDLETGASDNHLDLSRLRLSEVLIKTGASNSEITLPANAGATDVRIEAGAASIDIQVPPGVAARIRVGAMGAVKVDTERFPKQGGGYLSPNYETAVNRVDIRADVGLGSITIH